MFEVSPEFIYHEAQKFSHHEEHEGLKEIYNIIISLKTKKFFIYLAFVPFVVILFSLTTGQWATFGWPSWFRCN
jgi:hypothetical protein